MNTTVEEAAKSLLSPELFGEETDSDLIEVEDQDDDELENESEDELEGDDEENPDEENDDEDDDDDEDEEEPELFTVKVDGKEEQVDLEELKRGYSGQKFIQQGMQQVAEGKKQVEAVYTALMQERQKVGQLLQQAQQGLPQQPVPPDREKFASDPIGFMEAKLKYEEDMEEYNTRIQEFQRVAHQGSQAEQAAMVAHLKEEYNKLVEKEPEFGDKEKAKSLRDRMTRIGSEVYGYTPDEIKMISDHRAFRVLKDAMMYREMMEGKNSGTRKKRKSSKPARPGAKRSHQTQVRKAQDARRSSLKKTGSLHDAASLIIDPSLRN